MDALALAREAMTDDEREEYYKLNALLREGTLPIENRSALIGLIFGLLFIGGAAVVEGIGGMPAPAQLAWFICAGVAFFGGIIGAIVLGARQRRAVRVRRSELLATAATRVPRPEAQKHSGRSDDVPNWAKYPVTGHYDPELYRARGGRATASGMAAWGVEDYETYRTNVE